MEDARRDGRRRLQGQRGQQGEQDGEPVPAVVLDHAQRPPAGETVDKGHRGGRRQAGTGARQGDELVAASLRQVREDGAHERGHAAGRLPEHLEALPGEAVPDDLGQLGRGECEARGGQDEVEDAGDGEVPHVAVDDEEDRRHGLPGGEELGDPLDEVARAARLAGLGGGAGDVGAGAPVDEDTARSR
ncbi:hypothetical protein [Actinomyces radicidentis]|uniref:hypothetical protein n=1 Tax=Actinomyces radicidentis TaxID=111015 RepID=UPI0028EF31CC|nr:hypothetical protein [Actinomyces radicidentis]